MFGRRQESCEDRESFSPWESYSDLYCGLLLVFVLLFFFSIYQYISATETNNADTEALHAEMKAEQQAVLAIYRADMENQEAALREKTMELESRSEEMSTQQAALAIAMADLEDRESEIAAQEAKLAEREAEIEQLHGVLAAQQSDLDEKEVRLTDQAAQIQEKESELQAQNTRLVEKEAELQAQNALLTQQQEQLTQQQEQLTQQQEQLTQQQSRLSEQENTILSQQQLLADQAVQLEAVVGVRGKLIEELNRQLRDGGISLQADRATGAIVFDSAVLFGVGSTQLSPEGETFIRTFLPVYLGVLFRDEFSGYIAEIIVEGHTDNTGSYLYNLELSQQRALTVAEYCIGDECDFLSEAQIERLRGLIAINGCSYRNPVYNGDGTINPEGSRRVEIKFRLKDQEMIRALEDILNQ